MPDTMIERMASALSMALPRSAFAAMTPEEAARAALTAMREPTRAMCLAVGDEDEDHFYAIGRGKREWTAMIAAALAEEG